METTFQPPPDPPSLLTEEEIAFLSFQGWLPFRLPPHLASELDNVAVEAAIFFEKEHDRKTELYPPRNGTECGYYIVPGEKEYLTFRSQLHKDSSLESHIRSAWQQSAGLLHRILCDVSKAYKIDISAWDSLIDGSRELPSTDRDLENTISLMRVFRYFPGGGADQHTDVGLLTLCVGDGPGLQVVDHSRDVKRWMNVKGPVVLIGEVASSLLNGRVRAGIHRVIKNPEGRGSIVFALRPRLQGQIDLHCFGGEGLVDSRTHFNSIKADKYNINATKDFREQQRKTNKGKRI